MTAATRIVIVRHAQPHGGALVLPTPEVELDETGVEHAERLSHALASRSPAAVYSSPYARTVQTAQPLAALLGLEAVAVPDLREIDFGKVAGLSLEEVARDHPELMSWTTAPSAVVFPGGEAVEAVRDRAVPAVETLVRAHPGETVVVICHGVVIRVVLACALEMPLDAMFRFDIPYGSTSVIDWFDGRPLVRSVNASI